MRDRIIQLFCEGISKQPEVAPQKPLTMLTEQHFSSTGTASKLFISLNLHIFDNRKEDETNEIVDNLMDGEIEGVYKVGDTISKQMVMAWSNKYDLLISMPTNDFFYLNGASRIKKEGSKEWAIKSGNIKLPNRSKFYIVEPSYYKDEYERFHDDENQSRKKYADKNRVEKFEMWDDVIQDIKKKWKNTEIVNDKKLDDKKKTFFSAKGRW